MKKKTMDIFEAIDKISDEEFVMVEDVKDLLKNTHEGIIFFDRQDLQQHIKMYRRHQDKDRTTKAENIACIFIEWVEKQLQITEGSRT